MTPNLQSHWDVFASIEFRPQGATGSAPADWATRHQLDVPDLAALPKRQLDRSEVRAICVDKTKHVLFGYACAMAWGGQGGGVATHHPKMAWGRRLVLEAHLLQLRDGDLTRGASCDLFRDEGAVAGLGPAFFSKLLYFFSPCPNCYIMDQWTAKSVNLLAGRRVVWMTGNSVSSKNTGCDYAGFCREVDAIADLLQCSGQQAEERLFSAGGRPRRPWREHVHKAFEG